MKQKIVGNQNKFPRKSTELLAKQNIGKQTKLVGRQRKSQLKASRKCMLILLDLSIIKIGPMDILQSGSKREDKVGINQQDTQTSESEKT